MKAVSPKQAGRALGVSEATIKRWCDQGHIKANKTEGGHRRILISHLVRYARKLGRPFPDPTALDLPSISGNTSATINKALPKLEDALIHGHADKLSAMVFELYLNGYSIAEIGDLAIGTAFHTIGDQWCCGDVDTYQERRACQITSDVLSRLKETIQTKKTHDLLAIGGSLSGNHYEVANTLIEATFLDNGVDAEYLGVNIPLASFRKAAFDKRPSFLWLSISGTQAWSNEAIREFNTFYDELKNLGCALVIGGRGVGASLRKKLRYSILCNDLRQLDDFLKATRNSRGRDES